MLVVIESHPIQYHAPVYRTLQANLNIPVTVIYGSDFSVAGYRDKEFGTSFAWDTDLLAGYESIFLTRVKEGGPSSTSELVVDGLKEALTTIQPRAVLLGGYNSSFNRRAILRTWLSGYPVLFRGETTDHAQRRSLVKHQLRDVFLRQLYARCEKLLFIGKRSYQHYKRLGCSDEKLVFSPYCVDVTAFSLGEEARARLRAETRRSIGIEESQVVLLFSGKLSPGKRPDLLLQAVKELPLEQRDRTVVLFIGSGQLSNQLEQLAGSQPAIRSIFLGFKNQSELSPYYHAADLLVLPSSSETWGLVVNDALHHGLPCIVSDMVGCAPDLISPGETGEIFKGDSAQSLARTLQDAFALVNSEEVRARCLSVIKGYTAEKAAEGVAGAYASVSDSGVGSRKNFCPTS